MRILHVIPLMIIASLATCHAHSVQPSADGSIRLDTVAGRPVVDGVFLNGQGPFRFLLDTGAESNQVEVSIAKRLGITPAFRVQVATVGGAVQASGGRGVKVALSSTTLTDQEFLFTSLDSVHAISTMIQGVLGQEFLSHLDYLLDFRSHKLVLWATVPESGTRVSFRLIDNRPAIETSWGKMTIDSGTNVAVLLRAPADVGVGRVLTASGSALVSTIQSLTFVIGGVAYRSVRSVFLPNSTLSEDGELPANLFRAIFISNSGGYAVLDPGYACSRAAAALYALPQR